MTDLESQVRRALRAYRFDIGVTWFFRVFCIIVILALIQGSLTTPGYLPWTLIGIIGLIFLLWVHRDDAAEARRTLLFALEMIALDRRVEARGLALDQLEARIEAMKEKLK